MDNIKDLKINLESKILSSNKVVLIPHTPIDFDAFASVVGLSLVVSKLQKPFVIVIDDPAYKMEHSVKKVVDEAKKSFNIVNREKYLKTKEDGDLYVLTDVNKGNLICLTDELEKTDKDNIFIVDHHDVGSTTIETEQCFIDTDSSSASEIVFKLLNMFKVKYSEEVANYLLAGIYLDTNKLTKNVTPDTFKIVAKLMENGASNSVIDDWFKEDFESDKRVLDLVGKTRLYKYSFAIVLAEDECEYTREELAKVADYLLKYGVDASFAIGKIDESTISISARSKEKINVGEVMEKLEGGGNRYSAATKITDKSIEEVGKQLVKLIESPYVIN